MIHNDHEALKHLRWKSKLNRRHTKWVKFLEHFPYVIKHKQGMMNVVADALSRKHALIAMLENKIEPFAMKEVVYTMSSIRQLIVREAHEGGLMAHF
ncbi:hypothetical protein CR513_19277, partial [Mucuna pruriens]